MSKKSPASSPNGESPLKGVRYSLPQLLREVQVERNTPAFAMEKLEQVEITQVFQKNRTSRRDSKSRK